MTRKLVVFIVLTSFIVGCFSSISFAAEEEEQLTIEERVSALEEEITTIKKLLEELLQNNDISSMDTIKVTDSDEVDNNITSEVVDDTNIESNVLFSDDKYYVEYRGIYDKSQSGWIINLYIENNSDENIHVSAIKTAINGYTVTTWNGGADILPGCKYLAGPNNTFIFDLDDLKEYGIDTIETISFDFEISTDFLGDTIYKKRVEFVEDKKLP